MKKQNLDAIEKNLRAQLQMVISIKIAHDRLEIMPSTPFYKVFGSNGELQADMETQKNMILGLENDFHKLKKELEVLL